MTILNIGEDVEQKMFREMRKKQREAGLLDTWIDIPGKSRTHHLGFKPRD